MTDETKATTPEPKVGQQRRVSARIYYAHSISTYGTPQEARDVETLETLGFEVCNPNAPEHDAGYQRDGMAHFDGVLAECDALAFRAHGDGSIPAGVAYEIAKMRERGAPVIELPTAVLRRALTVEQTREYLRDCGAR